MNFPSKLKCRKVRFSGQRWYHAMVEAERKHELAVKMWAKES